MFFSTFISAKKESNSSRICAPTVQWPATHSLKNTVTANQEEKLVAFAVSLQVLPVPFLAFSFSWKGEREREDAQQEVMWKLLLSLLLLYTHKYVRANRCTSDIDASWRERVSFILIDYILPRDESGKTRESFSASLLFSLAFIQISTLLFLMGFQCIFSCQARRRESKVLVKNMGFLLPSIIIFPLLRELLFLRLIHFSPSSSFPTTLVFFFSKPKYQYLLYDFAFTHSHLLATLWFFLTKENSSSHQPPYRKLRLSFILLIRTIPLFSWLWKIGIFPIYRYASHTSIFFSSPFTWFMHFRFYNF